MRTTLVFAIRFYQKFLSSRKKYRCAYGVLHKSGSCSGVILEIVQAQPLMQLPKLILGQFQRCAQAYRLILSSEEDDINTGRCVLLPRKKHDPEDEEEGYDPERAAQMLPLLCCFWGTD